jgi:hypothetical protein
LGIRAGQGQKGGTLQRLMSPFETKSEEEVRRINELQRRSFDKLYRLFEPPLPEGVPERLARIVASGKVGDHGAADSRVWTRSYLRV